MESSVIGTFLLFSALAWNFGNAELKFDLDGNLLDDGLSRALAHSPEGSDVLIEEEAVKEEKKEESQPLLTTTTIASTSTTIQKTTTSELKPSTSPLFDILNESDDVVVKNVILKNPEADQVRAGAVLKVSQGGNKRITLENIHSGAKKENTSSDSSPILEDYQYLSYPQEGDEKSSSPSATTEPSNTDGKSKKFVKQVVQMIKEDNQKVNKTFSSGDIQSSTTEESMTTEPSSVTETPEDEEESSPSVKSSSRNKQEHSLDPLLPCFDTNEKACRVFKPLCNIQLEVGFRQCQKTCGFCRGKSLVYEAKLSLGLNGLVQFQQFFPGQPVYMTSCFEKSTTKDLKNPLSFVIHERKERPTEDDKSKCPFAGPHWNPYGTLHGNPHSMEYHHQGDLGNIILNKSSVEPPSSWPEKGSTCSDEHAAGYEVYNHLDLFTNPPQGLLLAIHMKEDDYGQNFFDDKSRETGKVGFAVGCGIIQLKNDMDEDEENQPSESSIEEEPTEEQPIPSQNKSSSGLPIFEKKPGPQLFEKDQGKSSSEDATPDSDASHEDNGSNKSEESKKSTTPSTDEEDSKSSSEFETTVVSSSSTKSGPVAIGVRELPMGGFRLQNQGEEPEKENPSAVKATQSRAALGRFIQERAERLRSKDDTFQRTSALAHRENEGTNVLTKDNERNGLTISGKKSSLKTNLKSNSKENEDRSEMQSLSPLNALVSLKSIMESQTRDSSSSSTKFEDVKSQQNSTIRERSSDQATAEDLENNKRTVKTDDADRTEENIIKGSIGQQENGEKVMRRVHFSTLEHGLKRQREVQGEDDTEGRQDTQEELNDLNNNQKEMKEIRTQSKVDDSDQQENQEPTRTRRVMPRKTKSDLKLAQKEDSSNTNEATFTTVNEGSRSLINQNSGKKKSNSNPDVSDFSNTDEEVVNDNSNNFIKQNNGNRKSNTNQNASDSSNPDEGTFTLLNDNSNNFIKQNNVNRKANSNQGISDSSNADEGTFTMMNDNSRSFSKQNNANGKSNQDTSGEDSTNAKFSRGRRKIQQNFESSE